MARKTFQISSINGGIANDRKLCKPWQVADCENIDLSYDSMSVKLAGQDLPNTINERGMGAQLIHSTKDGYLSKDGYFEEEGVYNEAVLKTRNPSHLLYTMFILPKHTTIYKGGDLQGYFESNGIGETTVYGAINLNHKTAYRDISYTVIATARFLHLVKSKYSAQPNIFSSQVENGDYSGNGWNYEADGYKHQEGNTTALTRTINQVLQSFQVEFACKEWTKGTLQLKIEYTGEEKTKLSSERSSSHKARTLLYTYKAERNMLINKVAIQGQSQWSIKISFIPSNDFDGKLRYNGLFNWGDLSSSPQYFDELYGARINYQKLKSSNKHPMIIIGRKLYVGCGNIIKVFMIEAKSDDANGNIQLVEEPDIELGVGMEIIFLTQYGDWLMIYANNGEDGYQLLSSGSGSASESTTIWRGTQFVAVSNDGNQDFVITKRYQNYQFWIVSGNNKQQLYKSGSIYSYKNFKAKDKYLFDFGWGISWSRMGRFLVSGTRELYLFDEGTGNWRLSKFLIPKDCKVSHIKEDNEDEIILTIYNTVTKNNSIRTILLNNDYDMHMNGSITLPTLVSNHEQGQLERIQFGAYLPNEKGSIEVWAMVNEKDYFTFEVKNAEGKDFSNCKLQTQEGNWRLELIDQQLENGEGWISFRTTGDIERVKRFNRDPVLTTLEDEVLLQRNDILSYDHYILVEKITRSNQRCGNSHLGYSTVVDLRKLNAKIGTFNNVSIRLKMSAWGTAESPRISAPIFYTYTVQDD